MSLLALLPLAFVSCVDEVQREPGEPELEGCYKVYFPAQENSGLLEFAPEDTPSVTFTVRREVDDDDITVPVKLKTSAEGIFTVSEVSFDEGQTESKFTVSFPDAEIGETYSCTVFVDDPQYAAVYGQRDTYLSFSVVRVKWDLVTGEDGSRKGLYRDDIFSSAYNVSAPFAEHEIEIYERSDKPGYYKIENLYDVPFMQTLFGRQGVDLSSWFIGPQVVYIDATDKNKVWIPWTDLNMLLSPQDGPISIVSDVQENQAVIDQLGSAHGYYGTLENGVLTFPYRGIYIAFGGELQSYGNNNEMFRILFPGAKVVDYDVAVSAGFAEDGVLPVSFTLGDDIAKVKYSVYEGRLSAAEATAKANEIASDPNAASVTESSSVEITLDATGVYTLVTANLDSEGTVQGSNHVSFGYVAAGETVPVAVTAGLIVSDKYAPLGYTSENSIEFYIYGSGLEKACLGLYKSSALETDMEGAIADLLENGELSGEELAAINGQGLTDVFINLNSGTEYSLLVYAENEYGYTLVKKTAMTEGEPDPLQETYTLSNIYVAENKADFYGNYKFYAKAKTAERELIGDLVISDGGSEMDEDEGYMVEYVKIKGLFSPAVKAGILTDDTVTWEAYMTNKGYWLIYSLANTFGQVSFNGQTYYAAQLSAFESGVGGIVPNAFVVGITENGDLAVVDSGLYAQQGVGAAKFLQLNLYEDAAYKTGAGYILRWSDLMFVDPENLVASAQPYHTGKIDFSFPKGSYNCVETVRTQVRRMLEESVKVKTLGRYRGAGVDVRTEASAVSFEVSGMTAVKAGDNARNVSNSIR